MPKDFAITHFSCNFALKFGKYQETKAHICLHSMGCDSNLCIICCTVTRTCSTAQYCVPMWGDNIRKARNKG